MGSTEDLSEFEHQEQYYKEEENTQGVKTSLDMNQEVHQNGEDCGYDNLEENVGCVDPVSSVMDDEPIQEDDFHGEGLETNDCNENEFQNGGLHQDDHQLTESQMSEDVVESTQHDVFNENDSGINELPATEENSYDNKQDLVEPALDYEMESSEVDVPQTECHEVDEDIEKMTNNYLKPDLLPTSEATGFPEQDNCSNYADNHETEGETLIESNDQDEEATTQVLEDGVICDDDQQLREPMEEISEPEILVDAQPLVGNEPCIVHDGDVDDDVPTEDQYVEEEATSHHEQDVVEVEATSPVEPFDESVVENTPVKRNDVVREGDPVDDVTCLKKGFAKDLAGFWSSPKNETCIKQVKQPIELPRDDASSVVENDPQKLDGVVRSDDLTDDYITVEQGHAKMMVNFFQSKKEENVTKELKLDINFEEPGVYENNPREREGVVKSTDLVDDIRVQKGVIKLITNKFQLKEETNQKPREVIKIEPAKGPSVIENNPGPQMVDVVRSDTKIEEDLPSLQGITKSLVHKWKTNDLITSKSSTNKVDDAEAILKAGMAAESGVFENQPSVRTDVAREDDLQPDIIPTQKTRSTRDLWNQKINQESRTAEKSPQLIRFTPPRELSPPRQPDENFTSFQQITLA